MHLVDREFPKEGQARKDAIKDSAEELERYKGTTINYHQEEIKRLAEEKRLRDLRTATAEAHRKALRAQQEQARLQGRPKTEPGWVEVKGMGRAQERSSFKARLAKVSASNRSTRPLSSRTDVDQDIKPGAKGDGRDRRY